MPRALLDDAVARRRADPQAPLLLPCTRLDTGEGNGGGTGAGGQLRDGRLVFPTVDGMAMVDPRAFQELPALPAVQVESANVDGFALDVDGATSVAPGPHHLQLRLATPQFEPGPPLFERRHVFGETTRVETGPSRQLDYTNLAPGDHVLEIRRIALDGRRGPKTVLRFQLAPRISETVAYRVGGPLALVGVLAAVVAFWLKTLRTRTRALQAELERDAVYRSVFERSPCAMFVHDQSGDLVQLNTAAIAVVGPLLSAPRSLAPAATALTSTATTTATQASTLASSTLASSTLAFVADCDRARYRARVQQSGATSHLDEVKMLTPEGDERTMLIECTRIVLGGAPRTLVAALDITAIRAAEVERTALLERHATSVRLEGLGRLAGGIAHDFNNVLTALRLQVEVLTTASDEPDSVRELTGEMLQAVEHGRDLTRRFLIFGRESGHAEEVRVLPAVERCAPLLRRLLRPGITLEVRGGAASAVVRVDPAHLDQVLMNLVLNAQHASGPAGTIVVRLARNEPLPADAHEILPAPDGPVVRLSVEDHGGGMSPEVLARAFEPFFSTRGGGSGIGLTVVQRVAQASGAGIHVVTAPGAGTTLILSFADCHPEPDRKPSSVDVMPNEAKKHAVVGPDDRPCVLVVDDEDFVRDALALLLRREGYAVVTAVDGADALVALAEVTSATRTVDLVITDLLMPNMGGVELIAALALEHPAVPIVVLSGFTGETAPPKDVVHLSKPVEPDRLLAVVHGIVPLPAQSTSTSSTSSSTTSTAPPSAT